MRTALVSDLHGNLVALRGVLADAERRGAERVVCLGDVVDLGPSPAETVALLRERGIPCVQGNHDPLDEDLEVPPLAAVQAWTREVLQDDALAWLADLPQRIELELRGGLRMLAVHGSPRSDDESILATTPDAQLAEMLAGTDQDVVVCGHTHVQLHRRLDERVVVNAGSVGMPFAAPFSGPPPTVLPWCEYAIVEARAGSLAVELHRIPLDLEAHERAVRASGMPFAELWLGQIRS